MSAAEYDGRGTTFVFPRPFRRGGAGGRARRRRRARERALWLGVEDGFSVREGSRRHRRPLRVHRAAHWRPPPPAPEGPCAAVPATCRHLRGRSPLGAVEPPPGLRVARRLGVVPRDRGRSPVRPSQSSNHKPLAPRICQAQTACLAQGRSFLLPLFGPPPLEDEERSAKAEGAFTALLPAASSAPGRRGRAAAALLPAAEGGWRARLSAGPAASSPSARRSTCARGWLCVDASLDKP